MPRKLKLRIMRKVDRQLRDNTITRLREWCQQYSYKDIDPLDWGWPENIMR